MREIVLCGRAKCCPVVTMNDDKTVTITDDYGGKVTLTDEQIEMLKSVL